jgi:glycosyltransferase involved in cell wall biosynthesis
MKRNPTEVTVSVVIPVLNEADYLADLLLALTQQTRLPNEVIIADAGSTDSTVHIARQYGARVIEGGLPAAGRNAGAAVATGEIILFLDADVLPTSQFIENILEEFARHELDIATCLVEAISDRRLYHLLHHTANLYLIALQKFSPHAPGFVILIRRDLHHLTGGFDETLTLAEDHDYVQRAASHGRFAVLQHVHLPVSVRRLETDGTIPLIIKYLWAEAHVITKQPIHSIPFVYQFGKHRRLNYRTNTFRSISEPMRAFLQKQMPFELFGRARQKTDITADIFVEKERE